jgi:hypothetical protein
MLIQHLSSEEFTIVVSHCPHTHTRLLAGHVQWSSFPVKLNRAERNSYRALLRAENKMKRQITASKHDIGPVLLKACSVPLLTANAVERSKCESSLSQLSFVMRRVLIKKRRRKETNKEINAVGSSDELL